MEPETQAKAKSGPGSTKAARMPRSDSKMFKGRRVYTENDRNDLNFQFPLPPEPEWEAEWNKRNAEVDKK